MKFCFHYLRNLRLRRLQNDSVSFFSLQNQSFTAKVVDVYDGDTCTVIFYYLGKWMKYRVRCLGYDSPEMKPSKQIPDREEYIRKAMEARNYFASCVTNCVIDLKTPYTKTEMKALIDTNTKLIRLDCGGWDKYGRLLGDFYVDGRYINEMMVQCEYGVRYDGGTKTLVVSV